MPGFQIRWCRSILISTSIAWERHNSVRYLWVVTVTHDAIFILLDQSRWDHFCPIRHLSLVAFWHAKRALHHSVFISVEKILSERIFRVFPSYKISHKMNTLTSLSLLEPLLNFLVDLLSINSQVLCCRTRLYFGINLFKIRDLVTLDTLHEKFAFDI